MSFPSSVVTPNRTDACASSKSGLHIVPGSFVSRMTLSGWLQSGLVRQEGAAVRAATGELFFLEDALRFVGIRGRCSDPYGQIGKVERVSGLLERGAVLSADAVRLGHLSYDVEFGAIATMADAGARPAGASA